MSENPVAVSGTHLGRRLTECGVSQAELARRLGKSQAAVSQWVAGVKRVSAEAAVAIERATQGQISRRELRPDLWGEAPALDALPGAGASDTGQ